MGDRSPSGLFSLLATRRNRAWSERAEGSYGNRVPQRMRDTSGDCSTIRTLLTPADPVGERELRSDPSTVTARVRRVAAPAHLGWVMGEDHPVTKNAAAALQRSRTLARRPAAVVFDCDGTLADTERPLARAKAAGTSSVRVPRGTRGVDRGQVLPGNRQRTGTGAARRDRRGHRGRVHPDRAGRDRGRHTTDRGSGCAVRPPGGRRYSPRRRQQRIRRNPALHPGRHRHRPIPHGRCQL